MPNAERERNPRASTPALNIRGAIDLASIMVGVIVIGLIAGVISATVFAVIPWAQDRAAESSLDAVKTAEAAARVKDGAFADMAALTSNGYLQAAPRVDVKTGADGTCWVAVSVSQSGQAFYSTSKDPKAVGDRTGAPDTSWCVNSYTLLADQVTNLATNPSFETAAPTPTTVLTNLALNPGAVPTGAAFGTWSGDSGGTGYASTPTVNWSTSGYAARHTWTKASANDSGNVGWSMNASVGNRVLEPDTTYTAVWEVVTSRPQGVQVSVTNWAIPSGAANTGTGTTVNRTAAAMTKTGEPLEQFAQFTTGPNTVGAQFYSRIHTPTGGTPWQVGDWVEMSDVIIVKGTYNPDRLRQQLFDGSTPASGDYTYEWTGEPNNSTSIKVAASVQNARGTDYRVGHQSVEWASTGTKSLRVTKSNRPEAGTSGDTFSTVNEMTPATLKKNTTYTVVAKIHLTEPQEEPVATFGREFRVSMNNTSAPVTYSQKAPNTSGTHEVRGTFNTSIHDTLTFIRLYNGTAQATNNDDVHWDDFMLVEGTYLGPYFDGNSANATWNGAADASTSTGWVRRTL